ncbi:MAG: hypothetical protein BWY80_01485 [Firmicutes bacterium ADurb.Bin456]|nr:MAG: hypothetical protein BWY80_01485 [Firmicutes bacterium ADurb.Bin456]
MLKNPAVVRAAWKREFFVALKRTTATVAMIKKTTAAFLILVILLITYFNHLSPIFLRYGYIPTLSLALRTRRFQLRFFQTL